MILFLLHLLHYAITLYHAHMQMEDGINLELFAIRGKGLRSVTFLWMIFSLDVLAAKAALDFTMFAFSFVRLLVTFFDLANRHYATPHTIWKLALSLWSKK